MTLGVSPFAIYLATLQAVIYRFSGRGQFLVCCPISLRRNRRLMHSVGYYVASVLVRADVHSDSTFGSLAGAGARELRAAYAAARLPYPHIVRAIGRGAKAGPLYRIAITQVDTKTSVDEVQSNCVFERFDVPKQQSRSDLNIQITQDDGGGAIEFTYDSELFQEQTIRRILQTYLRFLDAGCDQSERPDYPGPDRRPGRTGPTARWSADSSDIEPSSTVIASAVRGPIVVKQTEPGQGRPPRAQARGTEHQEQHRSITEALSEEKVTWQPADHSKASSPRSGTHRWWRWAASYRVSISGCSPRWRDSTLAARQGPLGAGHAAGEDPRQRGAARPHGGRRIQLRQPGDRAGPDLLVLRHRPDLRGRRQDHDAESGDSARLRRRVEVVTERDPATGEYLPKRLRRVRHLLDTLPYAYSPNQYAKSAEPCRA